MVKKTITVNKKTLGFLLFLALIIQFIFPQIKLGSISWISTLIYILVASYLTFL